MTRNGEIARLLDGYSGRNEGLSSFVFRTFQGARDVISSDPAQKQAVLSRLGDLALDAFGRGQSERADALFSIIAALESDRSLRAR